MNNKSQAWSKAFTIGFVLSLIPLYGLYQCDKGLATNRAWVSPCLLGCLLACFGIPAFLGSLVTGRGFRNALCAMAYFFVMGLTPSFVLFVIVAPRFLTAN